MRRLIAIFALFLVTNTAFSQDPFIPKRDAWKRSQRCFTVTDDLNNQRGAVWWAQKEDFSTSRNLNFVVYMGDKDSGADGMAFVLHNDPADTTGPGAFGDPGGGIGYGDISGYANDKIVPSVAIEFDTWDNGDIANNFEPGFDHTTVAYNGDVYNPEFDAVRLLPAAFFPSDNIEDDDCYTFQIRWIQNPGGDQTLELWVDNYNGSTDTTGLNQVFSHTDNMMNDIFGGQTLLRYGFTGSTGGRTNEQTICLLGENLKPFAVNDTASTTMNTSVIIPASLNDNDPDGDELFIPIIVDQPNHGFANIIDTVVTGQTQNFIEYFPDNFYAGPDTLRYVTCDVNSTKCYAKCDTAFVFIDVECPTFSVEALQTKPNVLCVDSFPANGAAEANAIASFPGLIGTAWIETFEDQAVGNTFDNGATAWSIDGCAGGTKAQVENFGGSRVFKFNDTDCNEKWISQSIDISGYSFVIAEIDLTAVGGLEAADFARAQYRLDNAGPWVNFAVNGNNVDNFGSITANSGSLTGNSIQLRVEARNSAGNEYFYVDNVRLSAPEAVATSAFNYEWYSTPDTSLVPDHTGPTVTGLREGIYTVIARESNSGCSSTPDTVQIDRLSSNLSGGLTWKLDSATTCIPPYNGRLGSGVFDGTDTLTAGYDFKWYLATEPRTGTVLSNNSIADFLQATQYAVVITDLLTGCDTLLQENVDIGVTIPTVTSVLEQAITSCTNPTGIASANVSNDTTSYLFEWWLGPIAGNPIDSGWYKGDVIQGTYYVHATDTSTGCRSSEAAEIIVPNNTVQPVPEITNSSIQISCDPATPTGSLTGGVVAGDPAFHSFIWFSGHNSLPANAIDTAQTISGLIAGDYRLMVVNDTSGCFDILDTAVVEILTYPAITDVLVGHQTACTPANGNIAVTPSPKNTNEYSYQLYSGSGAIAANLLTNQIANNLFSGLTSNIYTVTVTDTATSCVSQDSVVSVNDSTIVPSGTVNVTSNFSCDPTNPLGEIQIATVTPNTIADYNFEWFVTDTTGALIGNTASIDRLAGGMAPGTQYAVKLVNNATGCRGVTYAFVADSLVPPAIDSINMTPSTACYGSVNGRLFGYVDGETLPGNLNSTYIFAWYDVDAGAYIGDSTYSIANLAPGDYELTVINRNSACASATVSRTVLDSHIDPVPTFTVFANTSCNPAIAVGSITISAINANPGFTSTDYSYTWFNSLGTQMTGYFPAADSSQLDSLNGDTYELIIVDKTTLCDNQVFPAVQDVSFKPIIQQPVNVTDAANCGAPYLSGAEVTSIIENGNPVTSMSSFTFYWMRNDYTLLSETDSIIFDNGAVVGDSLPVNSYWVAVENQYGCFSDTVSFAIGDNTIPPPVSLQAFPNTACNMAYDNGYIFADFSPNAPGDYTTTWLDISNNVLTDTTGTLTGQRLDSLAIGDYRIEVYEKATQCTNFALAQVISRPVPGPTIDTLRTKVQTTCIGNPDGEITLQLAPYDTLPWDASTYRDYTFYLDSGSVFPVDPTTADYSASNTFDSATFVQLSAGTYTAVVVDEFTGCVSAPFTFPLIRVPALVINIDDVVAPSTCQQQEGRIGVSAQSLNNRPSTIPPGEGFYFTWSFEDINGLPNANDSIFYPSATDSIWTDFENVKRHLYTGKYVIQVYDSATRCVTSDSVILGFASLPIISGLNSTDPQQCAPPDGEISIDLQRTTSGPNASKSFDKYEMTIFEGPFVNFANLIETLTPTPDPNPLNDSTGTVLFDELPANTYTVVLRDTEDGCLGNDSTLTLNLNAPIPALDTTNTIADFACFVTENGVGEITVEVDGSTANAGFDYQWYSGTDTLPTDILAGATAQTLVNAKAGFKTVKITDNTGQGLGCTYTATGFIPFIYKKDSIETFNFTDVTSCATPNGTVEITELRIADLSLTYTVQAIGVTDYDSTLLLNSSFAVIRDTLSPVFGYYNLPAGDYWIQAKSSTTNCVTDIRQFRVDDVTVDPFIVLDSIKADNICDFATGDGEIRVLANGITPPNFGDFAYRWFIGNDTLGASFTPALLANEATDLNAYDFEQQYTVVVEDINAADGNDGCKTVSNFTLPFRQPDFQISAISVTDQNQCFANGQIQIDSITEIRDFANGAYDTTYHTPDFQPYINVELLDNNQNPITMQVWAVFDPVNGQFNNVPAGTYYVRAQSLATGCPGATVQVIVRDISAPPVANISLVDEDHACIDGTVSGALLGTNLTGGSDGDNSVANFNLEWRQEGSLTVLGSTLAINDLAAGTYELVITDISGADSLCTSTVKGIVPNAPRVIDGNLVITDIFDCINPGAITLNMATKDGINYIPWPTDSIEVELFDDNFVLLQSLNSGNTVFNGLVPGNYSVVVRDTSSNCISQPIPAQVNDFSVEPLVTIDLLFPQFSLNPVAATWTGTLRSSAIEIDGTYPSGYDYSWTNLGNAITDGTAPDSILQGLDESVYRVEAENLDNGCAGFASYDLPLIILNPEFEFSTTPSTNCGSMANGTISLFNPTMDTFSVNMSEFTVSLYYNNYVPGSPDSMFVGADPTTTVTDLAAGTYYVEIMHTDWLQGSLPVEIVIEDQSVYPTIAIDPTRSLDQTTCPPVTDANGALAVEVSINNLVEPDASFNFEWFNGESTDPADVKPNETASVITNQMAGLYTISATYLTNGCTSSRAFTIIDNYTIPLVTATTVPLTNCDLTIANGEVLAKIINVPDDELRGYTFRWYEGPEASGTVIDTVGHLTSLRDGFYTVVAQTVGIPSCFSDPITAEVRDETIRPNVVIEQVAPLTYCDPENPNGVISAAVDSTIVSGYTFDWYLDNDLTFSGPINTQVGNNVYNLVVTNSITRCATSLDVSPEVALKLIQAPEVDILSDLSSCITPNGEALANINNDFTSYDYFYFDTDSVPLPNPIFNFAVIGLDKGNYLAVARDRESGCVSEASEFIIKDSTFVPNFDVTTKPSLCTEPTGVATALVESLNKPYSVAWLLNGDSVQLGEQITELEASSEFIEYEVIVQGTEGCYTIEPVTIGVDVEIFNGISPNNDGLNDFFMIQCIQLFDNNNVKIFNRSGVMIFEMSAYDSSDPGRRFNGIANSGVLSNESELPVGTYYYIIDLKDGSEPRVGFLELNR